MCEKSARLLRALFKLIHAIPIRSPASYPDSIRAANGRGLTRNGASRILATKKGFLGLRWMPR